MFLIIKKPIQKNPENINSRCITTISVLSVLPRGLWRAGFQKSAQKTWRGNEKRFLFVLHLICSYKVHSLTLTFRWWLIVIQRKRRRRTFGAPPNSPSVARGKQRWSTKPLLFSHHWVLLVLMRASLDLERRLQRCPQRARLRVPDGRAPRPRSTTIKSYIRFLYKREPWRKETRL